MRHERRRGRQLDSVTPDLTGFQQDEVCEVTGFESRKREECKVRSVRGLVGGGEEYYEYCWCRR